MTLTLVQGDVMLKKIENINLKKFKKIGEDIYTLALGEKTGHSHVIHGDLKVFKKESSILVTVGQHGAILQHELPDGSWTKEHYPINIDTGIYEVIQQRELTLLDEIRSVRD